MRRARRSISLLLLAGMCLGLLAGCRQSEPGPSISGGCLRFIGAKTWEEYQSFLSDPAQECFLGEGGSLPEGFVEYGRFAMLGEFEFFTGPGISPMSNYHYKYRVKDGVSVHMSIRHLALELEEGEIVDDVDVYREKNVSYAYNPNLDNPIILYNPKISHPDDAAKLGNLAYQPGYEVISLNNVHYQYTSEGYLRYMTTIVEGLLVSFTTNSEITFNDYAPEEENFLVRMIRGEDVSEELRTILAGE